MPSADVSEKLLARTSNVNLGRMFHRNFRDSDVASIKTAVETMSKWQLEIRDDCHDLGQILTAARLAHARKPLKMLVVDYLQLVKGSRNNGDSREREVAEVSRQLRLLGLDLGCVVVALSQLNDDGRLRESRAIGQDATAVWAVRESQEEGCRDIYIPAQRNGESGVACELVFRGEYSSFNERG
jgi:replicative DNA helicase